VLALATCAAAVLGFAGVARAEVVLVTTTADSGAGSVRSALLAANPGDTISIPAPGDYQVTSAELAVTKNVSIEGSGPAVRLVGDGNNRVLNVTAGNVTISNLTVTGGGLAGASVNGGGIINGTGTLLLRNVTVKGNAVSNPTGGVPAGGGIFNGTGTLQVVDSTISGNSAFIGSGGGGVPEGGGIANSSGSVTITRSAITGNRSSIEGSGGVPEAGAIESGGGSLELVDSTLSGNTAVGGAVPEGGAIFAVSTAVTMIRTTLSGNAAAGGVVAEGGGIFQFKGSLTILTSTIPGNVAAADLLSIGGGLILFEATLATANVTIAGNVAAGPGEGGNLVVGSKANFAPLNTIVSGGIAAKHPNCFLEPGGATTSQGHNLDSLAECGFTAQGDLSNADPQLGGLSSNGGLTQTMSLAAGSPAVNAGSNAGCPVTDQRGVLRPAGGTCDIGAFELATPGASTGAASAVTTTTATLAGVAANPDLAGATAFFQYGPTTAYGQSTAVQAIGPTTAQAPLAATLAGLSPGTPYHFRLVVQNGVATTFGADQTFTTTALPKPPPPKPVLARLALSPSRFPAAPSGASIARRRKTGATVSYSDTQAGSTTFRVERAVAGVRKGRSCVKPSRSTRGRKRCTRLVVVSGSFAHRDSPGTNHFHFTGRIGGKALAPGSYRLAASPKSSLSLTGVTLRTAFVIIR
jgi:hypothetical protein